MEIQKLESEPVQFDPLSSSVESEEQNGTVERAKGVKVEEKLPVELTQLINSFLTELRQPKLNAPITPSELSLLFQQFYTEFRLKTEKFVKGSLNLNANSVKLLTKEELKQSALKDAKVLNYVQKCEDVVCLQLFDKLFNKFPGDLRINNFIKQKIETIQNIKDLDYYELLELSPKIDLSSTRLTELSNIFSEFNNTKSPKVKLDKLLQIHSSINKILINAGNADDFLPLLIYLILVNKENSNIDYYLNFIFIKRFRVNSFLVEEQLYCLTNFEASLSYIQYLNLSNYNIDFPQLEEEEHQQQQQFQNKSMDSQPTSMNLLSSALDTSFKSVLKFSKNANDEINSINDSYNPINRLVDVIKWRSSTPSSHPAPSETVTPQFSSTIVPPENAKRQISSPTIPTGKPQFKSYTDRKFSDLTITELETIFNDYCKLMELHNELK